MLYEVITLQLQGKHAGAIPYLIAARARVRESHVLATDEALVLAYVATGRRDGEDAVLAGGQVLDQRGPAALASRWLEYA